MRTTNPDLLRKETVQLMATIETEMKVYEAKAQQTGLNPFVVKDGAGNANYAALVAAKLTALNTLTLLNYGLRR